MKEIKIINQERVVLENVLKLQEITKRRAVVILDYATLTIVGSNLSLEAIKDDQSELTIEGQIDSVSFSSLKKVKDSFMKKMWN